MKEAKLFNEQSYTILTQISGKRTPVHKFTLNEQLEFDKVNVKDSAFDKEFAYFLVDQYIARINLDTKRIKLIDLGSGRFDKLFLMQNSVAVYQKNKSNKMLIWNQETGLVSHEFGSFVSNIIPNNKYMVVVLSNSECLCYDHQIRKKIWQSVAHNQFKRGLKESCIFQDNVVFIDPLGRLTLIDTDNGTVNDYRLITERKNTSSTSICVLNNGLCAVVDDTLLLGYMEKSKLKYKLMKIEGLKSVMGKGSYIVLEKEDSYWITTVKHLLNENFLTSIPKVDNLKKVVIGKNTLQLTDSNGISFYEMNTGELVQRIPSKETINYTAYDGRKLYVLADKEVSIYN